MPPPLWLSGVKVAPLPEARTGAAMWSALDLNVAPGIGVSGARGEPTGPGQSWLPGMELVALVGGRLGLGVAPADGSCQVKSPTGRRLVFSVADWPGRHAPGRSR